MWTNIAVDRRLAEFPCSMGHLALSIFSTCPSSLLTPDNYADRVAQVARWSESAGCTGILVYTDNSLVDPWLVSQIIIQSTESLCPLVAVQPLYMHPYTAAKIVATMGFLYERRMFLNMVAGGFKNDLIALSDATPHDARYLRVVEYARLMQELLHSRFPVTFEGRFYQVKNLILNPALALHLMPSILMSGSSEAGLAAAREIGATAVQYPGPPDQKETPPPADGGRYGVRIGIVARPSEDDAWATALGRFPPTRSGQLTRQLATKVSDSVWHHRLTEIGSDSSGAGSTYWLHPFENYQTNCPYLVGSYENVTHELARYVKLGYRTFILDIPAAEEEFEHIAAVFQAASQAADYEV